ncbi:hypothetical protein [Gemmatimonas sp.]
MVLTLLCVAATTPLAAQTIPRYSADLTVGQGTRPARAGDVWYLTGVTESTLRTGMTVRVGSPGRLRPVVSADYNYDLRGDQLALCGIAPNGSCYQYYPSTQGLSAGVGVRAMPWRRLTVGSAVGLAQFATTARYIDADAAVGLTRRLYVVAHWRRFTWRDAAGEALWFQPLTFGIRVQ